MTVPATTRRAGPFTGNGVTSTFPFSFKVFTSADIAVVRAADGVENTLVEGVDYTVALNPDQDVSPGGNVNLTSPLATGDSLVVVGDVDYDQQLDLPGGGAFRPQALENALDRTVIQIQQLREEVERTLRVPVTSDADIELPAADAGKLIGWDSTATSLQNYDVVDLASSQIFADWTYDTFTGNGVSTSFALQRAPGALGNIDVSIDGVTQVPGVDYAVSGSTLAFFSPPPNGTEILARYGSSAVQGVLGFTTEYATASSGQTVFTLTNAYTPGGGNLKVYVNGLAVRGGVDYLETNTTTVTFTAGLTAGDEVRFEIGGTVNDAIGAEAVGYSTVGGTSSTVKARFDSVVHVTDFPGVDPTGATDSSAGIQAAVNWAVAQAAIGTVSNVPVRTVGVFFPDGQYLINTGIVVGGGVALFSRSGRSARLFTTTTSAITMFTVGDVTDAVSTIETHFENLSFDTTQLENTNHVAIAAYRSFFGSITNCFFLGFYDSVVGIRMNRWKITRNRTAQKRTTTQARSSFRFRGSASGTGGGLHITNNELNGGGPRDDSVFAHILVEESDGIYAASNHTRDCDHGLCVSPTGALGANIIDTLFFVNNYFDNNHLYNVLLTGTVTSGGRYQIIKLSNCYMRGGPAGNSTNGIRISIDASGGVVPFGFSFVGGETRQQSEHAIRVFGASSGKANVQGLFIGGGMQFQGNNTGGATPQSLGLIEASGLVIDGITVLADAVPATSLMRIIDPTASITGVNSALANNTGEAIDFTQATSGRALLLQGNLPRQYALRIDQPYTLQTTDATPTTIWEMVVPQGSAGRVVATVVGVTSTGATAAVYQFSASFRRNAGGTTLLGGAFTTDSAWTPDGAPAPTAVLAVNTLRIQVTGVVSTTIDWTCHIDLKGTR